MQAQATSPIKYTPKTNSDRLLEQFHGDWKRGSLAAAMEVVGGRAKHGHDT
jgi:hypothetical protein